jgi:hypothetical protein
MVVKVSGEQSSGAFTTILVFAGILSAATIMMAIVWRE